LPKMRLYRNVWSLLFKRSRLLKRLRLPRSGIRSRDFVVSRSKFRNLMDTNCCTL